MNNGLLDTRLGRWLRLSPVLLAILILASTGSAASVCVDGDTLANYFAAGSCYVNGGLGVQVLFSFTSGAGGYFKYQTDSASDPSGADFTPSDIRVYGVTGPGLPEAGLRFETDSLIVPGDATFADVNVTFLVSLYLTPPGSNYAFHSAHLGMEGAPAPELLVAAGESDHLNSIFNLGLSNPSDGGDIPAAIFSAQLLIQPNIDLYLAGPNSQITSWVESFDLGEQTAPEPGTLALIPGAMILIGLFRNKRFTKSILPVVAVLTVLAAKSHANAVCTDLYAINGGPTGGATSLTIDKYIAYSAAYGGCTMNDMLFNITSFTATTTTSAFTIRGAAETDLVFSLVNLGNAVNDVQLSYSVVGATLFANQNLTITFQYSVTAPSYQISKMLGSTTVTGNPPPTRTTMIVPDTSPASTGSPANGLSPLITFNNALSTTFTVTDTFTLSGVNKHISAATDKFTEVVPEPVTSFLMGGALLGLGLLSRRRRG